MISAIYKERFARTNGKRSSFRSEFRKVWREVGQTVQTEFIDMRIHTHNWTVGDLVSVIDGHGLPFKLSVLAMEADGFLPCGVYAALERRGLHLASLRAELQAKAPSGVLPVHAADQPNARCWEEGDIVLPATAPKNRRYLRRVVGYTQRGMVQTVSADNRMPRSVQTESLPLLRDPLQYGIDANGER
jgi:hypothetical protein